MQRLLAQYELIAWVILANVALFCIPTFANWILRRRKRQCDPQSASLDDSFGMSYRRVFTYFLMGFGGMLVIWGALFLCTGLLDLATKSGLYGPSSQALAVCLFGIGLIVGGLLMIRFFRAIIRKGPNAHI